MSFRALGIFRALSTPGRVSPYVLAVGATAAAILLTGSLWPANRSLLFAFFLLAILGTAVYGHARAAAVAMVLSLVSLSYVFLEPYHSPAVSGAGAWTLGVAALVGAGVILLVGRLKAREIRSEAERRRAEQTLREQAELITHAQRIGRMGSWSLDIRTGRLTWPDVTCQLFGIDPADFTGTFEQFYRLILPEDLAHYDAARARLSSSEPLFEAEYRIRRPDGAVRWMYSRGRVDVDGAGNPLRRVGMVMDITEQRAAREASSSTATVIRTAGRIARLGGWTLTVPDRVLTWTDENCAIHDLPPGYKPTFEEGLGYYPPEDRAEVMRHVSACERDGMPYDVELRKHTATGRLIWVRSIGEAVRDEDGRIVRLQGAFQDITERRQAQQALRDSEALFRTLAESMPQMVWMAQPDGSGTYVNQRWVAYTGLGLDQIAGHGWQVCIHPDDRQQASLAWEAAVQSGDYNVECRLRHADGRYRWMLIRGLPLRDGDDEITGWIGTCTDIDDLKQAQQAAHESERVQRALATELDSQRSRLVAAQAVAGVGSWETDLSTLSVIWSAETYRICEADPATFQPTHDGFLALVHPDDRAAVDGAFRRSVEQRFGGVIEHRLLMADGRIKFVEERWQVIADDSGAPRMATGTCQDITERRRTQDAIRMQAHMLDQIGQAVIATDTGGRITYANRFAGELYGWEPGEILGRHVTDVTRPQSSPELGRDIMTRLERGESWTGEFPVQDRRGRVFPALLTDSPVLDDRRRLIGIVGISTDISARIQAEEEMRQKDALIRIAGRVTRTGGWAVEGPEQRVFWSDEVFDILDFPHGGPPPIEEALALYLDPWREQITAALSACAADGTPFDLEVEILTAHAARKWVRVSGEAVWRADGTIRRVQGAFQDITERKQLEQQYLRAQRMESIGTLAGGIAHDLNNVLAPILMSIGLLQDDEHDPDRLATLATIEASAKRGASMISRVLSFARGMEGRRIEVQLGPLLRDMATIVRDTFPKNIAFEERLAPDLRTLQADPTQLHQVLLNLCVNARDAMPEGGRIAVSARNVVIGESFAGINMDARVGPYVIIEVEDSGTGIPREIIDKIFDPFFTTKALGKGTGLGLATSMAIVKGHGGFMRASSDPGQGSRFQLYLPAEATRAAAAPAAAAESNSRGNGETILVVDDEKSIRQIARRTLEAFGYRVLVAADGAEAVALYAAHEAAIAVVVTDMMMPVMNGTATIQELVRMNPQVRIICASGLAADASLDGVAATRIRHFLSKPYTADTLLSAIRAAIAWEA